MRPVALGPVPTHGGVEAKVDWCIAALQQISRASNDTSAEKIADNFVPSNVTLTRSFDADTVTLAVLADIVGTFISDLKQRGSKR